MQGTTKKKNYRKSVNKYGNRIFTELCLTRTHSTSLNMASSGSRSRAARGAKARRPTRADTRSHTKRRGRDPCRY